MNVPPRSELEGPSALMDLDAEIKDTVEELEGIYAAAMIERSHDRDWGKY